jgi:RNA polymerase subunit RPABC4/transcription elongation factor Spt4
MSLIQFTRNYNDQSTDAGFQFEFYCDRCGNGYQTPFLASATGTISSALDAASSLFGGILGGAANAAHSVRSATWEHAHDAAFEKAVEEARPHFHKCKRCGKWVDDDCWNDERTLCKDCAPDLQEELSSIQVQAAIRDAQEKADTVDYVSADKFKQTIVAACPHCGAKVSGGKFCPECGKPLAAEKFCSNCGAKVKADTKFCPECGTKQ